MDTFNVQVLNINAYDDEGMVLGRPDQIERDVIVSNGVLIGCGIKSSMSRSGVPIFYRKDAGWVERQRNPTYMIQCRNMRWRDSMSGFAPLNPTYELIDNQVRNYQFSTFYGTIKLLSLQ